MSIPQIMAYLNQKNLRMAKRNHNKQKTVCQAKNLQQIKTFSVIAVEGGG